MKQLIGKVSQINMFVLVLCVLFVLFDLMLFKLSGAIGPFYIREVIALILSLITIKMFFRFDNRYK